MGIGLSKKEAAVYLACCELGGATANAVSKKSGVNRATTYVCLDSLGRKGYMRVSKTGKKAVYLAERPEHVLKMAKEDVARAHTCVEAIAQMLPEFSALYNVDAKKPQVMYMEGRDGLRQMYEEFAKMRGPYVQMTNIDDAEAALAGVEEARDMHHEAIRKEEISGRALLVTKRPFSELQLSPLPVDVRFLHYEHIPIHGEITVREETVSLFSFRHDPFATIIRSKTLADTVRGVFELAWIGAEREPGMTAEERLKSKHPS